MTVRIALLDDHRVFSEVLALALDRFEELEVVGTASTISESIESLPLVQPDVLVMGFQLRDGTAIDCANQLAEHNYECRHILLTAYDIPHVRELAIDAGFEQVLSKEVPVAEIARSIMAPPSEPAEYHTDPTRADFSPRQLEVLHLMGEGLDPAHIAEELSISLHTARGHVKAVLRTLKATSQLAAVTTAIREGYLLPPSYRRTGEESPDS